MAGQGRLRQGGFLAPEVVEDALGRLAKIDGQVRGISRMIGDGRYCVDVLDQIASVQKALDGVTRQVMRNYLQRCVTEAIKGDDPEIYDELMKVLFRYR
jgi:CsoR family transcriptional regulator, copper-sensing transcriptional repressor